VVLLCTKSTSSTLYCIKVHVVAQFLHYNAYRSMSMCIHYLLICNQTKNFHGCNTNLIYTICISYAL
uniref:Uncharacterized protein n=1 Tax=Amphimedon queenslandica TaxID=400682 RepID=A0A1X7SPT8_AMPQE